MAKQTRNRKAGASPAPKSQDAPKQETPETPEQPAPETPETPETPEENAPEQPAPPGEKVALKKVKITAPVRGTFLLAYNVGQEVEIDPNKADELIEAGCAEEVK